jgi:hypothetical protein
MVQKLTPSTFCRRRPISCCAHDLARDWKKWSRSERIAASLLMVVSLLMPMMLYGL